MHRLRKGERGGAVRAMLWWAAALALVGTIAFVWWPAPVGPLVVNGPEYRDEMFRWIRTGVGREGSLRLFLPQHLLHLAAFVAIGLVSVSAGAILMGALLMNQMSFYVASLARAGVPAWAVTLLGWQPWAIARVAAFATLGVLLAEPLLFRLYPAARARLKGSKGAAYVVAAISGILTRLVPEGAHGTALGPLAANAACPDRHATACALGRARTDSADERARRGVHGAKRGAKPASCARSACASSRSAS